MSYDVEQPNCHKRTCKHFLGLIDYEIESEVPEIPYCSAFPKGIPDEIAYGSNEHLVRHPEQDNDIVYELYVEGSE